MKTKHRSPLIKPALLLKLDCPNVCFQACQTPRTRLTAPCREVFTSSAVVAKWSRNIEGHQNLWYWLHSHEVE